MRSNKVKESRQVIVDSVIWFCLSGLAHTSRVVIELPWQKGSEVLGGTKSGLVTLCLSQILNELLCSDYIYFSSK